MTADSRTLGARAIRDRVSAGDLSANNVAEQALRHAAHVSPVGDRSGLNLLLAADASAAKTANKAAMRVLADDPAALLLGVPYVAKDNIATLGLPTTCGSRILESYVSPYEATVISRLRRAGAILVGKSNMDEFGMGSSNENSAYGPARNPLAPDRVPGGSSGGSAGCVAAGIVPIALGSDTGGSVRQPAAFCGVVGLKPTYGRVSRYGLVAFASSLDQIGVIGRTVDDAALALRVIAGHDPLDSTSAAEPVPDYSADRSASLKGMTIGVPNEYFLPALDSSIRALCDRSIERLRSLGAEIKAVSLPHTEFAVPAYYVIAPAEASSNLARFDGVRYGQRASTTTLSEMYTSTRTEGFGAEVMRRIVLGTYVLSAGYYDAYYRRAQQVRALIASDFAGVFGRGVHALFTPTTPTPAFPLGSISAPHEMYMSDVFTVTANLAGIPALSLPIGRVGGLPIGGQLLGPHFGEPALLKVAYALERALGDEAHA